MDNLTHEHGRIGAWICTRRPCATARRQATAEAKEKLRAAIEEERERLYAMIDTGDADSDELLALFARNGSTDRGTIRRARHTPERRR